MLDMGGEEYRKAGPDAKPCNPRHAAANCASAGPRWSVDQVGRSVAARRRPFLVDLSSRTADHEVGVPAPAARAHEPLLPIEKRQVGAVASDLLGHVGLDLMGARLAPDNQRQMRPRGGAERRRAAYGLAVSPLDRHTRAYICGLADWA